MARSGIASRILASGWIIAALGIGIDLASDVGNVGLTDLHGSLKWAFGASGVAVIFAVTNAILLYGEVTQLRWVVVGISSLFALYLASFLLFGGEGTVLVRFVVPLAFLLLAIWTVRVAWGWRMQAQGLDP